VSNPTLLSPLTRRAVHLCIDMQRIFAPGGLWATPWMERVLPVVTEIAGRYPERSVFTRFITPERPEAMPGTWLAYYRRWHQATRSELDPQWLELLDPLRRLAPPATVVDKSRYSAFAGSNLLSHLQERHTDALIITGSETDVCVLSTVLDAVDFGFRVVLVRDGVCSSSDAGHDALLTVYHQRYSLQIETADAEQVLVAWER
jgi:nicotinamidase-related amidase